MSQFVVNLQEPEKEKNEPRPDVRLNSVSPAAADETKKPKTRGGCRRILVISGIILAVVMAVGAIVGYFYWQGLKQTPQYSLALLVDAARRGDQAAMDELVDTDAVVDSFLPQIREKAIELYGKNLPKDKIGKVEKVTESLKPSIKQRAREEVPRVIQEKTDQFASIPYWAIAIGAGRYLDIKIEGETAIVTSKIPERQFELTMKRNGDKWRVIGIKDDALARRIAETIGQELISISTKDGLKKASEKMNVPDLENMKKKLDDIFK